MVKEGLQVRGLQDMLVHQVLELVISIMIQPQLGVRLVFLTRPVKTGVVILRFGVICKVVFLALTSEIESRVSVLDTI
jgi:hypothetical protein